MIEEIGTSSNLRPLLQLYAELCERNRNADGQAVTMSSPLHSQESNCSSDEDNNNNHKPEDVSQPFYAQLSQPPTPRHKRQPLVSKQPRVSQDRESHQRVHRHDHSSLLSPVKRTKLPLPFDKDLTDGARRNPEEVVATLQSHDTVQQSADLPSLPTDQVPVSCRLQVSKPVEDDRWPGGKTALLNGRYLPRYLAKISKSQQEILQAVHAWQPSKADRRIRGSVPNDVLKHFTELADKAAEIASKNERLEPQASPTTDEASEEAQPQHGRETDPPDSMSESSDSQPSICPSWSPTPRTSVAPEPALPVNSSPLQAPQRRPTPSSLRSDNSIKNANPDSTQEPHGEGRLGIPSPRRQPLSEIGHILQTAEASPCAEKTFGPLKLVQNTGAADKEGSSMSHRSSPEDCLSPEREQREIALPCKSSSSGSDCDRAPQQTDSVSFVVQDQGGSSRQKADGKAIIQVQRTPFAHQPHTLIKRPELTSRTALPYSTPDEAWPLSNPEPKSSTSVVPDTFMIVQADQHMQSQLLSPGPLHHDPDSFGDEHTEGGGKVAEISRPAAALHAASETYPSSSNEAISESEERISQQRPGKRKYCSEEHVKPWSPCYQSPENQQSCSDHAPSKRHRAVSTFPSLEALRDIGIAKPPSEIARESRRGFFQDQQRVGVLKSSPPVPAFPVAEPHREGHPASPLPTHRKAPDMQKRNITPSASLLPRSGAKAGSGISLTERSLYDAYRATYPEYEGDAMQFYKACMQIKILYREGKAPHPSLWDDFIFRRHHDYRDYLLKVTEACEDALPYLEYYTQHVEKPSRMELVVKPAHILSLEPDSALGSSVISPALAAQKHLEAARDLERSVAASSSASNILPAQPTVSPAPHSSHRTSRHQVKVLNPHKPDHVEQTQESSVKQWVELQSMEKPLGAESPELGSASIPAEIEDVPQQDLEQGAEKPAFSSPRHQPAEAMEEMWYDEPNTPFKSFARSFAALPSEKRQLKEAAKGDEKGCLKPQLQKVIDIFTLYRR